MSIGSKFDGFMDWMFEGSLRVSLLKFGSVALVTAITLVSPFLYLSDKNQRAYNNLLSDFKQEANVLTLRSVDEGTVKGLPKAQCEESRQAAMDKANSLGTSLSYDSQEACEKVHGTGNFVPKTTTQLILVGKSLIPNNSTSYVPPVIAWQAAKDDLKKAVPLYPTADPKVAMRFDGQKVALEN